jgi:hypothetical protein
LTLNGDFVSRHIQPSSGGRLAPTIGVFRETGTLNPYHAEALARGRLHHDPTLQTVDYRGAEFLEAAYLSFDVVALDVYVNAALVVHALDLHERLIRRGLEHTVIAARARVLGIYRSTERFRPEASRFVDV